jgi:hypothetical protein
LSNKLFTWDMASCPTVIPATKDGFQVNGTVSLVTGNGSNAPFEPAPPTSTLQVCVTGGTHVPYSNVSFVFAGPAITHFGSRPIHGVVRKVTIDRRDRRWTGNFAAAKEEAKTSSLRSNGNPPVPFGLPVIHGAARLFQKQRPEGDPITELRS